MAEELRIPVSVSGAQQAQQELRAVAEAERSVATATGTSAEQSKQASEAADLLAGRQLRLLNAVRMLGPEAAMAIDAIQGLTRAQTAMGVSVALAPVAVLALIEGIRRLTEANRQAAEASREAREEMDRGTDAVVRRAEAVERVNLAQQRSRGLAMQPEASVVQAAAQAAAGGVVGAGGVEEAARIEAAGRPLSEAERTTLVQWVGMGLAEPFKGDAFAARAAFEATGIGIAGRLAADTAERMARGRPLALSRQAELAPLAAGVDVNALIIREIASREAAAGRPGGEEGLRAYLGSITGFAPAGAGVAPHQFAARELGSAQQMRDAATRMLQAYPEAGDIRFSNGQTFIQIWGFNQGGTQINQSDRRSQAGRPVARIPQ